MAGTEGDTVSPTTEYVVSLNKISKDRFLPVGPTHPENLQLIDVRGEKMELLFDAPVDPEPHYAQIIRADRIEALSQFPRDENREGAIWRPQDARIERDGNVVTVYAAAVRSRFIPDVIEVNEGDLVRIYITNIDEEPDISHGFGIGLYNINVGIAPGETKLVEFVADKTGVFPYYCTDFCSALHQEMQGWLLVKPADREPANGHRTTGSAGRTERGRAGHGMTPRPHLPGERAPGEPVLAPRGIRLRPPEETNGCRGGLGREERHRRHGDGWARGMSGEEGWDLHEGTRQDGTRQTRVDGCARSALLLAGLLIVYAVKAIPSGA